VGVKDGTGVKVVRVEKDSPAERAGISAGAELIGINGQLPEDIIDYRFLQADEHLQVTVQQSGAVRAYLIEKDYDTDLGLDLFWAADRLKSCRNKCVFCFVDQLPPGMRPTLRVKDDDYRYSVLTGNFITLTNLSAAEMDRITGLHLGPLHISVHTTNPELRAAMMGNPDAAKINADLARLAAAGIAMHYQIVLCPGYNDGAELARTVHDLAAYWPQGQSVGIVPVGLTRYRESLAELRPVDTAGAAAVIRLVEGLQSEFRKQFDYPFVFAADEFYTLAGKIVPPASRYGGFPQLENGIGLIRLLLNNTAKQIKHNCLEFDPARKVTFVTGSSAAPYIRQIARKLTDRTGLSIAVAAVPNAYFGPLITVAGLLTGRDILNTLQASDPGEAVFIPSAAVKDGTDVFLDGMTITELERALRVEVQIADELGQDLLAKIAAVRERGR